MNAALLEHIDEKRIEVLAYGKNPTLSLIPKDEDAGGKYIVVPVVYEVNQGRSSTFANAQGNQTAAAIAEFLVTRKSDYDVATIDNQTLEASASSVDSFLRASVGLIEWAIRGASSSAGSSLFRSGTGSIGQISSIASGVITLTNPADIAQFGLNQTLQANSSDGGTPRAALGYVIARSIRNGTVTVSATALNGAAGSPSGWTANDFLLVQGDNNNKFSGFSAWFPLTDPTSSDNFYGVNRSVDYRLFGVNFDGSGQAIEEAIIDHTLLLDREGSSADHVITNPGSYAALVKALGTRREYIDLKGPADVGFRGIVIDGGTGEVRVFRDRHCQVQTAFVVQMDTLKLVSLGPVPKVLRYEDRVEMLRVYNADAAEARIAYYANLICYAPGWCGQLKLSA